MLYSPLTIEMAGVASIWLTVMAADSMGMFSATGFFAGNVNAAGTESAPEAVVEVKLSLRDPIWSNVLVIVPVLLCLVGGPGVEVAAPGAVAARGLFRGFGVEDLATHGIGFGLSEMPSLAAMASGVVAEEQALRRPVTVVITPSEPGIEDVGTGDQAIGSASPSTTGQESGTQASGGATVSTPSGSASAGATVQSGTSQQTDQQGLVNVGPTDVNANVGLSNVDANVGANVDANVGIGANVGSGSQTLSTTIQGGGDQVTATQQTTDGQNGSGMNVGSGT